MATIKIVDEYGNYKTINQYQVNDINIVQEIGEGIDKVMSQKAVTEALNDMLIIDGGEY